MPRTTLHIRVLAFIGCLLSFACGCGEQDDGGFAAGNDGGQQTATAGTDGSAQVPTTGGTAAVFEPAGPTSGAGGDNNPPAAGAGGWIASGSGGSGGSADAGTSQCPPGWRLCAGACVDISADDEHCGACDAACAETQTCRGGVCEDAGECSDPCPYSDGVKWLCKLRFMYGVNYAWHQFASDFGGNSRWNQSGVSGDPSVESELANMANNGVNVIRWWVWPDFRGDGVMFDGADNPIGLGGTALADLEHALQLGQKYDLYFMFTLFSFDNFRPTRDESGIRILGITEIVLDESKRTMLMDNVVAPFAGAVAVSPHASRVIAWDVINEPEWAISGASLYGGDPQFDPMTDLGTISHAQMETFVRDVINTLRSESDALITVGGAAIKWRYAWSNVDIDFHQFHIYDWVDQYWPYSGSPMSYGIDDRPVVMGEFPWYGLSSASYATMLESWFSNGYAGALAWAYTDGGRGSMTEVKGFADSHSCQTRY